ncbi:hypothetical protein [Pseudomonas sp. Z4-20]|uniref:hypothetical protein n=1 Tax=Pseudomonas sp. Z4-20 TaxID=2817414 RepID=UPI003DA80511
MDELNYKISILNNLHIPVLVEEFSALRKETSNTYDPAKRAITLIPVSLQTDEIVSLRNAMETFRENPALEQQQAIESLNQDIRVDRQFFADQGIAPHRQQPCRNESIPYTTQAHPSGYGRRR